jgi:hypothetical protein
MRKDYTVGVVTPFQGEYTYTDNRVTGLTGHLGLLELQMNW